MNKLKSPHEDFGTVNAYLKQNPIDSWTLFVLLNLKEDEVGGQFRQQLAQLQNELGEVQKTLEEAQPDIKRGQAFGRNQGKKVTSPIRRKIDALLKKQPDMTNDEIWQAVKAAPPKGWELVDSTKLGRYLNGPGSKEMAWGTFRNHCGAARKSAISNRG